MASIQAQFEAFDKEIRLGRFDESAILREKRNIIRETIEANLPAVFAAHGKPCPNFYFLDQGSYVMDTGVKPLDGDFDIDQGLYFEISIDAYPDPVVLKEYVYEAIKDHTDDVRIRRSCVTVFYQRAGESIYHVDIAIYSAGEFNSDGKPRTGKGKQYSEPEHRYWQISNPDQLTVVIFAKFEGADRAQFRRIVRYLKRWKDFNFPTDGNAAPNGIGLTVATYDRLRPAYTDVFSNKHDDLTALRALVSDTLSRFGDVWDESEGKVVRRLVVRLPVEPWADVFAKMTGVQMAAFEDKLKKLGEALEFAATTKDVSAACARLGAVFGDAFPEVKPEEEARTHPRAISSSGNSA